MPFRSILYDGSDADTPAETREVPEFFADLRLDQVVASIIAGRQAYDLAPFYQAPLRDTAAITYRHEVFRDLEDPALLRAIQDLAQNMRAMRDHLGLAGKAQYRYQRERWFLDAAGIYCDAVIRLDRELSSAPPRSRGFLALRDYLAAYVASDGFGALLADTRQLKADLASITYRLQILGGRIRVSRHQSEPDYSADVAQTFEKFKRGAARSTTSTSRASGMNHVEAAILDRVALLYPDIFAALDGYCDRHREYLDETIRRFDREVQFYVAYLEHVGRFRPAGLAFCYPAMVTGPGRSMPTGFSTSPSRRCSFTTTRPWSRTTSSCRSRSGSLSCRGRTRAGRRHSPAPSASCTTWPARLSRAGLRGEPVPRRRDLQPLRAEEDLGNQRGKLEDDLLRIHRILEHATRDSLLMMNESFGSTAVRDALYLEQGGHAGRSSSST